MHLGISCAESEMEPRALARYRISRERRPTGLSEPIRQVVAAWLVTVFVLVAGLSVLVFHERSARDYGPLGVAPRGHSPPVAGAGEPDERLCCSRIRACASELPDERECDGWRITQSRSSSASMCSSDDYRGEEPIDCC